jgi:hypothetical protein
MAESGSYLNQDLKDIEPKELVKEKENLSEDVLLVLTLKCFLAL